MDDLQYVSLIAIPHFEQLMELYANEWWTNRRSADDVRRMLDATRVQVGLVDRGNDRLVAFGRVVTDEVYNATLCDVIVHPGYRRRGLGDRIMALALDHPRLAQLRNPIDLQCREDKVGFYARWGFEPTQEVGPNEHGRGFTMHRPVGCTTRPA